MAERILAERLQPSILDRLTDESPGDIKEHASYRAIDVGRLREIILRDLAWLLNTSNIEARHDLERHPHVARSTLNYGILDLSGSVNTRIRTGEIQQAIRKAIETFEPRILSQTLEVIPRQQEAGTVVSFDIHGELWAEPVPIDLHLRTAVDVSNGEITVSRQG